MKFRRLLASILSALMIISCFSFVASAAETITAPVAVYTAKAESNSFNCPENSGMVKTRAYDSDNDKIYYRFTPGESLADDAGAYIDAYNLGTISPTSGVIYLAVELRTNVSATPHVLVYSADLNSVAGTAYTGSGGSHTAESATVADGSWERVVIKINNSDVKAFQQLHIKLLGNKLAAAFTGEEYFDVSAFAFFKDQYSAENYNFADNVTGYANVTIDKHDNSATTTTKHLSTFAGGTDTTTLEEELTRGGYTFKGWSTTNHGTALTDITEIAIPTVDVTYYALWEMDGNTVENEKAVYVNSTGCDKCNDGRSSAYPVATIGGVQTILKANTGIDTVYVSGTGNLSTAATTFGVSDRTIKVRGLTGTSDVFDVSMGHLRHTGSVDYDNVTIKMAGGDGNFMGQGHDITFGKDIVVDGKKTFAQYYYGATGTPTYGHKESAPADVTTTFNGGSWVSVHGGTWTGDPAFYGKSTVVVNGADIGYNGIEGIKLGHGSNTNQRFYGTFNVIVNSGNVTKINLDSATSNSANSYDGLRCFTINGGTVGEIIVTSKETGTKASSTIDNGVTVVEVNAPNAVTGSIKQGAADDDAARVVIYNNGSYVENQVTDAKAIVLNVTGAKVSASATEPTAANNWTSELTGFTYTLTDNTYDQVTIGEKTIALSTLSNDTIPATEFGTGVNTVTFSKAVVNADYTVETYTMGTDGQYGAAATETKSAEVSTTVTVTPEAKAGFTVSDTSITSGEVTADGNLTLKVYYSRNQYKLYTKLDDTAEATAAGTYYYEATVTAPADPEKDGYTFKAWDPEVPATMPANDVTLTATWEAEAPATVTLKFYADADATDAWVTKTVDIGATDDVLPVWSDIGLETKGLNDTFARPVKAGYYLKGWTADPTAETPVLLVPGTFAATEDESYYAVWEEADMIAANEVTVTLAADRASSGIPANATGYFAIKDGNTYTGALATAYDKDGNQCAVLGGRDKIPGLSTGTSTGTQSYYGTSSVGGTDIYPANTASIWYKWNDGQHLRAVPTVTGEVNVAYVLSASPSASTKRGLYLEAGNVAGTLNIDTIKSAEQSSANFIVSLKTTLEEGDVIKFAAPADFDNTTIKSVQLLAIYVWQEAVAPTTANYTVETYTMGTDGQYGEAAKETKSAEVDTTVSVTPEARTGFTVADTSVTSGEVTADGNLTLKVYYARNQYKLYTKADAEAEATEAGTYYYEATVTAPAAPTKDGYTFKAWNPEVPATMPANDVTLTATWEVKETNKVYISSDTTIANDTNDGLTAQTPVATMSAANTLLAAAGKDTLVVVGTYKVSAQSTAIGVADKPITITGNDENAVFDYNWKDKKDDGNNSDDSITLNDDVTFTNIKINGDNNDGRITTNGHKVVFGVGVTYVKNKPKIAVDSNSADDARIEVTSGSYNYIYPGRLSGGTFSGKSTIIVSGTATVNSIRLGHGWRQTQNFYGILNATIDGGTVSSIGIQGSGIGNTADNGYKGLRYFTINNGSVGDVITTASSNYWNGKTTDKLFEIANRSGVSVFEINRAGVITGTIKQGVEILYNEDTKNGYVSTTPADDDATRIVIFNNGSYEEGKVTDTGAIVFNVKDGAIKADVTVAEDYTATLKGYTFTTDKAYININGTNYPVTEFTSQVTLASDGEPVTGLIPYNNEKLTTNNVVTFADAPIVTVTWKVGEETVKTDTVEAGTALTAPTASIAPDKDYYYTFKAWNDGTADIADIANYVAPADGATLTAVFDQFEMDDEVVKQLTSVWAMDNGKEFTSKVETVDGVEAVKAVYTKEGEEGADLDNALTFEGYHNYPENNSAIDYVGVNENKKNYFVDASIYEYVAVRYYYVPGSNTAVRNMELKTMQIGKNSSVEMDTNKWSYAVYQITADGVSMQYHLTPMVGANIGTLITNEEVIYVDTMGLYQSVPTVATVTFEGEDGTVLYAIDALNSEAVTFNGTQPTKDGYTFKGWAIEGETTVVDALTFAEDTTLVPVFEKAPVVVPEGSASYKTYGVYENGKYTVQLKFSGAKAHLGSFGFQFPASVTVTPNTAAGIVLFAEEVQPGAIMSPIFAKSETYYANTWAVEGVNAETGVALGYIDATTEEVLIATFEFDATETQVEEIIANDLTEYVVTDANAKYYRDGHYLSAPKIDSLDTEKIAIIYTGHEDVTPEEPVVTAEYKTYGTYDPANETYTINVAFKGGKVNMGAFGIAFNSEYMTYDPTADGAFTFASGIQNYLGIELPNTAAGVAFAWDGSGNEADGYIDATDAEITIATIKAKMTAAQRAAYVAAEKPAFTLLDITSIDAEKNYFDGTDYLVVLYENGPTVDRTVAKYTSHEDDEIEITNVDVKVKVTFSEKKGATTTNIGYITVGENASVAIDEAENTNATVEYTIANAAVGQALTIKIEKNGYIAKTVTYTPVVAADNTVEITLLAGDIKGSATAICGDGVVSLDDFVRVIRAFEEGVSETFAQSVDIDESGSVNVTDLAIIKNNFGADSSTVK